MLRDDIATCPACGRGLDVNGSRLYCGCGGVLVTEDELREMIAAMETGFYKGTAAPHELALEPTQWVEPPRTCPRCTAKMTKHTFYGMTVDRCEAHGIWFDDEELQAALKGAGDEAARMPLGHKIAAGAGSVIMVAFYIASLLAQGMSPR